VELAHQQGILTAASLMIAAAAAADAITRARRLPSLRIGLHLVLVDGTPLLPPERLPDLVDATGRLRGDLARLGLDICARSSVRGQLRAEIEAQFCAYRATGLALDHVTLTSTFIFIQRSRTRSSRLVDAMACSDYEYRANRLAPWPRWNPTPSEVWDTSYPG
jgi:hypothetical protein